GYDSGYQAGTNVGYDSGYQAGTNVGYDSGYQAGQRAAPSTSTVTPPTPSTSTVTPSAPPVSAPTPSVSAPSTVNENPAPSARTVYVTKTGKRYHYDDHCNGGTYYEATLAEALQRGLTPCQKCVG
ncbi:MAG: hypothetical protein IJT31_00140, partial [Oscillibacter sp.]|nr:hypothetical protein [Oscillibacter sp.]